MITVSELKRNAKKCGVIGYSCLRKSLLKLLGIVDKPPQPTVKQLKLQAKELGLRDHLYMRKAELVKLLKEHKPVELRFVWTKHAVGKYLRGWRMDVDKNMDVDAIKPLIADKVCRRTAPPSTSNLTSEASKKSCFSPSPSMRPSTPRLQKNENPWNATRTWAWAGSWT